MAQWEVCRVVAVQWKHETRKGYEYDSKVVFDYYAPTGVITKFSPTDAFGQAIGVLSAAGWELVSVQHRLFIHSMGASSSAISGDVTGRLSYKHPSGDSSYVWDGAEVVAYFKRPVQAGRKIDDAL